MSEEERFWFRMVIILLIILVIATFFHSCANLPQPRGEEHLWKALQAEQEAKKSQSPW